MPPLAAIERFFERLLERPSARLFRARLQPIQLQRRIERAMEAERLSASNRTLVPNRFVVQLHPTDLAAFGEMTGSLATELADGALLFARSHRYTLVDRPRVDLVADPAVDRAEIRVVARFADPIGGSSRPVSGGEAPALHIAGTVTGAGHLGGAGPTDTVLYTVPRPTAPTARLRVLTPDGTDRTVGFDGTGMTIGRAPDNDLVLADGRVSRHHARLAGRRGTLVFIDLGSTNGSRINGVAVGELVLGAGDRIEVGDTRITVEVAGDVG